MSTPTRRTVLQRSGSPRVEHVEVDGETVAFDTASGSLHLLDPLATVIWKLLDGSANLLETSDDLASALGRPRDEMLPVVLELAGRLEDLALVHRVAQGPAGARP